MDCSIYWLIIQYHYIEITMNHEINNNPWKIHTLKKRGTHWSLQILQVLEDSFPAWLWMIRQVIREKSAVWVPIPKWSPWWRWRIISIPWHLTASYIVGSNLFIYNTNNSVKIDIKKILQPLTVTSEEIIQYTSWVFWYMSTQEISVLWWFMLFNRILYRSVIKWSDAFQIYQKIKKDS